MEIKGIKEIISLGKDGLNGHDFITNYDEGGQLPKIEADVFIYAYSREPYEGSGTAVWRKDDKWAYDYIGHCSCHGPLENIETADKMKFTLKQILEILEAGYQWTGETKLVTDYLKEHYKK